MRGLLPNVVRSTTMAGAMLMAACGNPGYNSNPSQQNTDDWVGCLASTDFFAVYFSLHLQPVEQEMDARVAKELFQSYCNDLPQPGTVFFTADLAGNELKRVPIGVRIVERATPDGDANRFESSGEGVTIEEIPPQTYPKGFIERQFVLSANGRYAIELIRGGNTGTSEKDILRIPVNVGIGPDPRPLMKEVATKLSLTVFVILFCTGVFRVLRYRRIM